MRRLVLIGLATFAVALAGLLVMRSGSALHPPFPRAQAAAAAQRDPLVHRFLVANSWDDTKTIALDERSWRVTFLDGMRTIADVAVGPRGNVVATEFHGADEHPAGSKVFWNPALLILFAALFVLAVGVRPLKRARNADALVVAAFTLAPLALDARLVWLHALVGAAGLAYVAVRCAQVAAAGPRERSAHAPLVDDRVAGMLVAACAAAVVLLVVTSTVLSDVAVANLTGATELTHGVMPYGHDLQALHGDTYPLLSYVLYMPGVLLSPVRDAFDSTDSALWLCAVALLLGAALAARAGGRLWALAWLSFPAVVLAASSGTNDVPAGVFVLAALLAFGRPLVSAVLWTLAGGIKVVPGAALLADLTRVSRPGRLLPVVLAVLGLTLLPVLLGGALADAWQALRFQFTRGSWFSLWQQIGARWLQLPFQAAIIAAAAASFVAFRERRDSIDLRRAAAIGGAFVAALQFAANYWTYAYLPWLLPFILAALFPPARQRSQQHAPDAP